MTQAAPSEARSSVPARGPLGLASASWICSRFRKDRVWSWILLRYRRQAFLHFVVFRAGNVGLFGRANHPVGRGDSEQTETRRVDRSNRLDPQQARFALFAIPALLPALGALGSLREDGVLLVLEARVVALERLRDFLQEEQDPMRGPFGRASRKRRGKVPS